MGRVGGDQRCPLNHTQRCRQLRLAVLRRAKGPGCTKSLATSAVLSTRIPPASRNPGSPITTTSEWCRVRAVRRGAGSAISGVAFEAGGNFPASYDGALFFTDFNRGVCGWFLWERTGTLTKVRWSCSPISRASAWLRIRQVPLT